MVRHIFSAAIIVVIFLLICLEITLRTFFSTSTHFADELVGYGVGIAAFFALGESLESRALIRVGLIIEKLNSTWRRIFEIFSVACIAALWMIPIYMFALGIQRAYARGYTSDSGLDTPLWIPQLIFLIGLTIFLLHLLSYLLRLLSGEMPLDAKGLSSELDGKAERNPAMDTNPMKEI